MVDESNQAQNKASGGRLFRNVWLISLLVFVILFIYFNFENVGYRYDILYQFGIVGIGIVSFCFWIISRLTKKLLVLSKILKVVFIGIVSLAVLFMVIVSQLFTTKVVDGNYMSDFKDEGLYLACIICRNYKRGDVVTYSQNQLARDFSERVGRIVGLPNEEVELEKGKLIINGSVLDENYADWSLWDKNFKIKVKLNPDEYFILLDKRESGDKIHEFINSHKIEKTSIVAKLLK